MKNILALLADAANGIFALLLAAHITETQIVWWYVPVSMLLALLPDIDALPELFTRGKVSASAEHVRDHRTFIHYPIIALVFCIPAFLYGGFWGLVVTMAVIFHLLNDLYGTGWGLALTWPLSENHFKIFGRKVNRLKSKLEVDGDWDNLSEDDRKFKFLVVWSKQELPFYIKKWGYEDWIDDIYLKLNWISVVEYCLFIISCALLIFTVFKLL